jgi:hypothetical protein
MVVSNIISRADTQDLMLAYNLPAFAPGDPTGFLAGLARVSGLIKKVYMVYVTNYRLNADNTTERRA